jgi:hypothetical protein
MRYHVLAVDYDGTLATHGRVPSAVMDSLQRLRATGRHLVMVTGRELGDLFSVFDGADVFELIVAENGALLYRPATREVTALADAPPPEFAAALARAGVAPVSVGRVVVATREPHEGAVLETIRALGLELQVVFNKGAVMVLPSGVNKGTGLRQALRQLGLSPRNAVAVGDAENDHALLSLCECGVAVANALPALKERADLVARGGHGAGVVEVVEALVAGDLASVPTRTDRRIPLGAGEGGCLVTLDPWGTSVLLAGTSGAGKSTVAKGLLERIAERGYQFCVVDPEGDYADVPDTVCVGDTRHWPANDEVLQVLGRSDQNAVVNLLGVKLEDRPKVFESLFAQLQEMRSRLGRPHWLLLDETHHVLPRDRDAALVAPQELGGLLLVTVHPDKVAPVLLGAVDAVLAIGTAPRETMAQFASGLRIQPPEVAAEALPAGETLVWWRRMGAVERVRTIPPRGEHRRHVRKYATGEIPAEDHFFFRGPGERLNLRVQNLITFLQIAEGVDDETWVHHLRRGDYSRWFRAAIKDDELAAEAEAVERVGGSPRDTRDRIREAVEKRYTAPA